MFGVIGGTSGVVCTGDKLSVMPDRPHNGAMFIALPVDDWTCGHAYSYIPVQPLLQSASARPNCLTHLYNQNVVRPEPHPSPAKPLYQ